MPEQPCHHSSEGPPKWVKWGAGVVFLVGGGYYLWMQHRAHVLQYAPLAIFLLCPLMHLFGGHGKTEANDHEHHQPEGTS